MEETQKFIECLLKEEPVPVNGYDGIQAERIALAAKLSLSLGRPVKTGEVYDLLKQTLVEQ